MTATATRPGVLSAGRVYCDLIFSDLPRLPSRGTEVFAGGLGLYAGGGAAITAAHLAALGRPAHLAGMVPGEPFGAIVRGALDRAEVSTALCRNADPASDPQVTVALTYPSDRAFITHRTGPAVPDIGPNEIAALDVCHLHIGELATLLEQPWLVDLARGAGMTVSLDCGWDDSVTAAAADLIAAVDLFLPNEAEADFLRALGIPEPFAPATVVKLGAQGAEATVGGTRFADAAEKVAPVDSTGAGDAFNAGFIDAWLDGAAIADCLRRGNRCGAHAIATRGGFGPADRAAAE